MSGGWTTASGDAIATDTVIEDGDALAKDGAWYSVAVVKAGVSYTVSAAG